MNRTPVHFLHVRKTGGSALRRTLEPVAEDHGLVLGGHNRSLRDVPADEGVVFGVRDPVTRFVSGFNSRLRRGQPLNDNAWRPEEAWAFARFPDPNTLAEALSDPLRAEDARRAMRGIRHVHHRLAGWLVSPAYLRSRTADIVMILHQPDLDRDFAALRKRLSLPENLSLPTDPLNSHRTPEGFSTDLSATAKQNLREWYARDIALYKLCLSMRARILGLMGE